MDNYSEIRVPIAHNNPSIRRKESRCVLCGKCKDVCAKQIGVAGYWKYEGDNVVCINCGQCANVCPVDSIEEQDDTANLMSAINSGKKVVFMLSPSVRVSLGEMFNMPAGESVAGKIVAALKKLGASYVFDTTFGADLTIMEEASELIERIKLGKNLPQFTSCCPAWVKFVETFYPQYIPNLSTCRSPIGMQSSVIKHHFAKQQNLDGHELFVVAITPCVAKKYEAKRSELVGEFGPNCDLVITVRELGRLIKRQKINFKTLKDAAFDTAYPTGSGAGVIFGASGGVMEAAVRTAYYLTTGENPPEHLLKFTALRGTNNIKTAKVTLLNKEIKLCVIFGTAAARSVLDKLKTKRYDFIEVMTCPNGCVGGGGQPKCVDTMKTVSARANGLYAADEKMPLRLSYLNPQIKTLYTQFLGEPLSATAKKYLHTTYQSKK